jgi:hypothetical protein
LPIGRDSGTNGGFASFHGRHQSVAPFGDGLDVAGRIRPIAQRLAQLDDRLGERIVADDDIGPDGREQRIAAHHLLRPLGQIAQQRHRLGLELHRLAGAREPVQRRLDRPAPHAQQRLAVNRRLFRAVRHPGPPRGSRGRG